MGGGGGAGGEGGWYCFGRSSNWLGRDVIAEGTTDSAVDSVHRLHYWCKIFVVGQVVIVHVPLERTCPIIHLDNEDVLHYRQRWV